MGSHSKRNRRAHRPMRPHLAALERTKSPRDRLPIPVRPLAQRLRRRSSKSLQKIRLRNPKSPRSLLHHPKHKHPIPKSRPPDRNAPSRQLDQTLQRHSHAPRPLHSPPQITSQKIPPHIEFPPSIHYNKTRPTKKDNHNNETTIYIPRLRQKPRRFRANAGPLRKRRPHLHRRRDRSRSHNH